MSLLARIQWTRATSKATNFPVFSPCLYLGNFFLKFLSLVLINLVIYKYECYSIPSVVNLSSKSNRVMCWQKVLLLDTKYVPSSKPIFSSRSGAEILIVCFCICFLYFPPCNKFLDLTKIHADLISSSQLGHLGLIKICVALALCSTIFWVQKYCIHVFM